MLFRSQWVTDGLTNPGWMEVIRNSINAALMANGELSMLLIDYDEMVKKQIRKIDELTRSLRKNHRS